MKLKIDDEIVEDKNADEDTGNGNFDFSRTHTNKEQCIRNLEFLRDSYLAQIDGVEKRLFNLKSNLIACIGTYASQEEARIVCCLPQAMYLCLIHN